MVSTAQRWKMPVYLQIGPETDPQLVTDLSPHVLCYDGPITELADVRQWASTAYRVMPAQVCEHRSEVEQAFEQSAAAVLVAASLFEDMRFVKRLAELRG